MVKHHEVDHAHPKAPGDREQRVPPPDAVRHPQPHARPQRHQGVRLVGRGVEHLVGRRVRLGGVDEVGVDGPEVEPLAVVQRCDVEERVCWPEALAALRHDDVEAPTGLRFELRFEV